MKTEQKKVTLTFEGPTADSEAVLTVDCSVQWENGVVVSETLTLSRGSQFDEIPPQTLCTVNASQLLPMDRLERTVAVLAKLVLSESASAPKVETIHLDDLAVNYCGAVNECGCAIFIVDADKRVHSVRVIRESIDDSTVVSLGYWSQVVHRGAQ